MEVYSRMWLICLLLLAVSMSITRAAPGQSRKPNPDYDDRMMMEQIKAGKDVMIGRDDKRPDLGRDAENRRRIQAIKAELGLLGLVDTAQLRPKFDKSVPQKFRNSRQFEPPLDPGFDVDSRIKPLHRISLDPEYPVDPRFDIDPKFLIQPRPRVDPDFNIDPRDGDQQRTKVSFDSKEKSVEDRRQDVKLPPIMETDEVSDLLKKPFSKEEMEEIASRYFRLLQMLRRIATN